MLDSFLSPTPSLKICGVTSAEDAQKLVDLEVDALGLNFWPSSKRYCSPEQAAEVSGSLQGQILRVGVFVNNAFPLGSELFEKDLIDVVQLHGDETYDQVHELLALEIPVIWAVSAHKLPEETLPESRFALLIDTPAGKDYGGTGKTFDWTIARQFREKNPEIPVILAGGIIPENAASAWEAISPVALDVASGAESKPGVKDFRKVAQLLAALEGVAK